jgi:hypothetical protein
VTVTSQQSYGSISLIYLEPTQLVISGIHSITSANTTYSPGEIVEEVVLDLLLIPGCKPAVEIV